jgi:hypothetical protein
VDTNPTTQRITLAIRIIDANNDVIEHRKTFIPSRATANSSWYLGVELAALANAVRDELYGDVADLAHAFNVMLDDPADEREPATADEPKDPWSTP